jgi:hypothetical protein
MAQVRFEEAYQAEQSNNDRSMVGFLTLKDDGDEAIVRIMHDSTADFDILTTHDIQVDGRYRKISCTRNPKDPMENCPLCKSGARISSRFFIHLLQYTKDETGNIVVEPKVWERSMSYATTIRNLIGEYGPLSDCVFKIKRSGKAGDMNTTYSILYTNPSVYTPELYPKKPELLEGYSALGTVVLNKTPEEINHFVTTGSFLVANQNVQQPAQPEAVVPNPGYSQPSVNNFVSQPPFQPTMPVDDPFAGQSVPQRPIRYYD